MPKIATVERLWPGSTIVCLASGPSLTPEDVAAVRGKARVIAVNATYAIAPWADVIYGADADMWLAYWAQGPTGYEATRLRECQGLKFSLTRDPKGQLDRSVVVLRRGPVDGLSRRPDVLHTGQNSGYQAINLAVHLGAARIVLLGYDMQRTAGREHWHANHPHHRRSNYARFLASFPSLVAPLAAARIEIVNCTRRTLLHCFPERPLAEVLPASAEVAA